MVEKEKSTITEVVLSDARHFALTDGNHDILNYLEKAFLLDAIRNPTGKVTDLVQIGRIPITEEHLKAARQHRVIFKYLVKAFKRQKKLLDAIRSSNIGKVADLVENEKSPITDDHLKTARQTGNQKILNYLEQELARKKQLKELEIV